MLCATVLSPTGSSLSGSKDSYISMVGIVIVAAVGAAVGALVPTVVGAVIGAVVGAVVGDQLQHYSPFPSHHPHPLNATSHHFLFSSTLFCEASIQLAILPAGPASRPAAGRHIPPWIVDLQNSVDVWRLAVGILPLIALPQPRTSLARPTRTVSTPR